MNGFEKFKEVFPSKEQRTVLQFVDKQKNSDKEYEHVCKALDKFERKPMKDYHDLYLKRNVLLLADMF